MQAEKLTLKRTEKLKSRKIINQLFETGKVIHSYPFKLLYNCEPLQKELFPAQIAISVSKKSFKKAVDRNYIKRKIREAYRIHKPFLYKSLIEYNQKLSFFVIYTAKEDMEFILIEEKLKNLINKLLDNIKTE